MIIKIKKILKKKNKIIKKKTQENNYSTHFEKTIKKGI